MTPNAALSVEEKRYYHRHLILKDFGEKAQLKLKNSKVLVVGAGGLGCPLLQYLAAAGVGNLVIVDGDVVSESNLHRQILFGVKDVGQSKAEVAAQKLRLINPHIEVRAISEFLNVENARSLFREVDLIVDGSDNFSCRYLVNDAAVLEHKPFVAAAIFRYEGQLSVYNFQGGPTYRCLFPNPPLSGEIPNCSEAGVLGVLPGVLGTLQANEVIKVLTGVGEPLSGVFLTLDLKTLEQRKLKFRLNPRSLLIERIQPISDLQCVISPSIQNGPEDYEELLEWMADPKTVIIDVREEEEREFGFIAGSVHLPLPALLELDSIPTEWENKRVLLYCKTGQRSLKALEFLEHFSLPVSHLEGGVMEWSAYSELGLEWY